MFSLVFQGNYVAQWDADKVKIHVGNELPELVLAKANAITMSNVGLSYFARLQAVSISSS